MSSVQIVGAGYVGGAVARHFSASGQRVTAITRTGEGAQAFQGAEVSPIVLDLTQPKTLSGIIPAEYVVISVAPDQRDEAGYREVYVEGVGNYLTALQQLPPPLMVIYLSSTGVWGARDGAWVDEQVPSDVTSGRGKVLVEAERQVLSSGFPAMVLRLGGIYGPGRNRLSSMRDGSWPSVGPDAYMNLIHLEDIVAAIPVLIQSGLDGSTYIGVDDEPVKRSEFCAWIADRIGVAAPASPSGNEVGGKRCRNTSLKSLGWTPKYPSFREGYQALIAADS